MKAKVLVFTVCHLFIFGYSIAQDRASVYTMSKEISDNLDIRAVASIFGESTNLGEFERKLNDPRLQISNLDLNEDLQVDYLRVIESMEYNTHVVIIQAVLGRDQFQDVASIDIEKDRYNNIRVQFIGDEFLYGRNFIYEPVFYRTPAIYASFYISNYRPYRSTWNWNYYPNYYIAWRPYATHRYISNIYGCINVNNTYRYVHYRNSKKAYKLGKSYRHNDFERRQVNNSYYNNRYRNNYPNEKSNFHRNNVNNYPRREQTNEYRNNTNENYAYEYSSNKNRINKTNNTPNDESYRNSNKPVEKEYSNYQITRNNKYSQTNSNRLQNPSEVPETKNNRNANSMQHSTVRNTEQNNGRRNSNYITNNNSL